MTHTPGPWPEPEYDNHGNGGYSEWWDVGHIAQVKSSVEDARLIAAAPDMLEALKVARDFIPPPGVWNEAARVREIIITAIHKAEAEGR